MARPDGMGVQRSSALYLCLLAAAVACRAGSTAPPATLARDEPSPSSVPSSSPEPATAVTPAQSSPRKPESAEPQRLRVFYSGHSLLDNPLPDWVELIAQSRGNSLGWEQQIVLGSPIRVRTKGDDPDASGWPGYRLGKSKSGGGIDVLGELSNPTALAPGEKYDRLLITERNDFLGAIKWENTAGYLRDFHDRLASRDPENASTLLYQCWPEIDRADPGAWIRYVRDEWFAWQCVAAMVNRSLKASGQRPGVSAVAGGVALAELVERALAGGVPGLTGSPRQRLDRIFSDDVHLTPIGTYLISALHYGALFGESPLGAAAPREVPTELVPFLQTLAAETLSKHAPDLEKQPSLGECKQRIAAQLCPAYYRRRGKPDEAAACGFWASAESPLSDARATPR